MLIPIDYLMNHHGVTPSSVLHVGAHLAEEAHDYHRLGFEPVTWIEGNPDLLPALNRNLADTPNQRAIGAMLSDSEREVTFHIASNGQSSSYLELGTHRTAHPEVTYIGERAATTTTIDTLLGAGTIDEAAFINLDTQGTELDILRGADKFLERVEVVYSEVNVAELYVGCALFDNINSFLLERGFEFLERRMTGAGWGDAVWKRRRPC